MTGIEYIGKITKEQFDDFFHSLGAVKWRKCDNSEHYPTMTNSIFFEITWKNDEDELYEISDFDVFSGDTNDNLTCNDIQAFLRKTFGDEYMKYIEEEDIPIDFVSSLTEEEIEKLYEAEFPHKKIISIKEVEAFIHGTRRFKVCFYYKKEADSKITAEYIISPEFDDGRINYYNYQKAFVEIMIKKFGYQYAYYYLHQEYSNMQAEIRRFVERSEADFQGHVRFVEELLNKGK